MRVRFVLFLFLFIPAFVHAQAPASYTETQKIDHLITYLRNLKDATFIRNGSEHTGEQAAAHLEMKRNQAGKHLKTVEQFISDIASKSSLSGKPYMIRFKDGKEYSSEMVLRLELKKLMEGRVKLLKPQLAPVQKPS